MPLGDDIRITMAARRVTETPPILDVGAANEKTHPIHGLAGTCQNGSAVRSCLAAPTRRRDVDQRPRDRVEGEGRRDVDQH